MLGLETLLAAIFLEPFNLDGNRLGFLLPLCLSIAVVYKTTKVRDLRDMPLAATLLFLTIIGGMAAVTVALYVLILIFIR